MPAPRLSTYPLDVRAQLLFLISSLSIVIRICFPRLDLQSKFLYIQSLRPQIFLFLVFPYSTKSSSARINRISSPQYDSHTYPSRRARHCWPNLHVRQVLRDRIPATSSIPRRNVSTSVFSDHVKALLTYHFKRLDARNLHPHAPALQNRQSPPAGTPPPELKPHLQPSNPTPPPPEPLTAPPQSPPLHIHFDQSETFQVLSGKVGTTQTYDAVDRIWTAADAPQEVTPWTPHNFWPCADAEEDTTILVWAHPENVPEPMDWLFFQNLLWLISDISEGKRRLDPFQIMLLQ